jgi:hypothetical protein
MPRRITPILKDTLAEAVHRGVCDFTDSDGVGQCFYYATASFTIARLVTGLTFQPQIGAIHLRIDEPEVGSPGWFHMECEGDGFDIGDFHAWAVVADSTGTLPLHLIDFSSRHWDRLHEKVHKHKDSDEIPWTRPKPPTYIWYENGELPDWIQYEPKVRAMRKMYELYERDIPMIARLNKVVIKHWNILAKERDLLR